MKRASGIILPVTALPSGYGIGDLGAGARAWIDFLAAAGQSYWQILPMGNPSGGTSPYQTDSAFACDPAWIDPEGLIAAGWIAQETVDQIFSEIHGKCDAARSADRVDHVKVRAAKDAVLRYAWGKFRETDGGEFSAFRDANARWLEDYVLYRALKKQFGGAAWMDWPEQFRDRRTLPAAERPAAEARDAAVGHAEAEDAAAVRAEADYQAFVQYVFRMQWDALHSYAREKGVRIIGDIPIYVPLDSADVWAHRHCFRLDADGRPTHVAGCPPDYFSEDGQLWGNPLYDWDFIRDTGYAWWIDRIGHLQQLVDVLRIDHFRGFASYYSIPAGSATAKEGEWLPGPGMDLIGRLTAWFHGLEMIAEDLGTLDEGVFRLLEESRLPGMKVLQFAFEADADSAYLPHKYDRNCVCYTGTHDNDTLAGWLAKMPAEDLAFAKTYLGLNDEEGYLWGVIRGGMASAADLFMMQLQDILELGSEARYNEPGTVSDRNWSWRMPARALEDGELAGKLRMMTRIYGR